MSQKNSRSGVEPKKALAIKKARHEDGFLMAGVTRLELATSCVTGRRSNQLSYTPIGLVILIPNIFFDCKYFFINYAFFL